LGCPEKETAMRDRYKEFQDQVFQEIQDLQSKDNRRILTKAMAAYGLTDDDLLLLYKPGMDGKELLAALEDARKK
jgi:hypothetical protein